MVVVVFFVRSPLSHPCWRFIHRDSRWLNKKRRRLRSVVCLFKLECMRETRGVYLGMIEKRHDGVNNFVCNQHGSRRTRFKNFITQRGRACVSSRSVISVYVLTFSNKISSLCFQTNRRAIYNYCNRCWRPIFSRELLSRTIHVVLPVSVHHIPGMWSFRPFWPHGERKYKNSSHYDCAIHSDGRFFKWHRPIILSLSRGGLRPIRIYCYYYSLRGLWFICTCSVHSYVYEHTTVFKDTLKTHTNRTVETAS